MKKTRAWRNIPRHVLNNKFRLCDMLRVSLFIIISSLQCNVTLLSLIFIALSVWRDLEWSAYSTRLPIRGQVTGRFDRAWKRLESVFALGGTRAREQRGGFSRRKKTSGEDVREEMPKGGSDGAVMRIAANSRLNAKVVNLWKRYVLLMRPHVAL